MENELWKKHGSAFIEEVQHLLMDLRAQTRVSCGADTRKDSFARLMRGFRTVAACSEMFGYMSLTRFATDVEACLGQISPRRLHLLNDLCEHCRSACDYLDYLLLEPPSLNPGDDPKAQAILRALRAYRA